MSTDYWRAGRQMVAVAALSAAVIAILAAGVSAARAADLLPAPNYAYQPAPAPIQVVCPIGGQTVTFFDRDGRPTPPARTPYFYCATGETFLPGDIPPPPEYCCQ
ncbi:hypothetical protein [Afifella sp. IM 167]|uniref:hypothetical protein n=1 Tax=Afifella sp. IM 167 TaxID=2033586 RepID=UPI001CCB9F4C|nr:hypothetical protein [Afifella sp. IM 167]MBZ8131869.1 hypothetical protein [Afifella sp. IM 167]